MFNNLLTILLLTACYGGPSKLGQQDGSGGARLYSAPALSDVDGVKTFQFDPNSKVDQVFKGSSTAGLGDASVSFSPGSLSSSSIITMQPGASVVSALSNNSLGVSATGNSTPLVITSSNNEQSSNPFTLSLPVTTAGLDDFQLDGSFNAVFALVYKNGVIYERITDENLNVSDKFVKLQSLYFGSYQAVKVNKQVNGTFERRSGLAKIGTLKDSKNMPTPSATPTISKPSAFNLILQIPAQNSTNIDPRAPVNLGFSNPLGMPTVGQNVNFYSQNSAAFPYAPPIVSSADKLGLTINPPDNLFPLNAWQTIQILAGLKDQFGQSIGSVTPVKFKTRDGIWGAPLVPVVLAVATTNAASFAADRLINLIPGKTFAYWTDSQQYNGFTALFDGVAWQPSSTVNTTPSAQPIQALFFVTPSKSLGSVYRTYNAAYNKLYFNKTSGNGVWGTSPALIDSNPTAQAFDIATNAYGDSFLFWTKSSSNTDIYYCQLIDSGCIAAGTQLYTGISGTAFSKLSSQVSGTSALPYFALGIYDGSVSCYGFAGPLAAPIATGGGSIYQISSYCADVKAVLNTTSNPTDPGMMIYEQTSPRSVLIRPKSAGSWGTPQTLLTSNLPGIFKTKSLNNGRTVVFGISDTGVASYTSTLDGVNISPNIFLNIAAGAGTYTSSAVALDFNDFGDILFSYMYVKSPSTNYMGATILDHDGVTLRDVLPPALNPTFVPADGQLVASLDNAGNGFVGSSDFSGTFPKIQAYRFDSTAVGVSKWTTYPLITTSYGNYTNFPKVDLVKDGYKGTLSLLYGYCTAGSPACAPTVTSGSVNVINFK